MKEIKFKFWRKDIGIIEDHKGWIEGIGINEALEASRNYGYFQLLYSGLFDIHGKEIYSGNILDGNIGKHIVRFGEFDNKKDYADHSDGVGFYLERDGKCNYSLTNSLIKIYNLEVIGNIYESPNLLK